MRAGKKEERPESFAPPSPVPFRLAMAASAGGDFPDFLAIIEQYEEDERLARMVQGGGVTARQEVGVQDEQAPAPALVPVAARRLRLSGDSTTQGNGDRARDSIVRFEVAQNGRPVIDPAQLISVLRVHSAGVEDEDEDGGENVRDSSRREDVGGSAAASIAGSAGEAAASSSQSSPSSSRVTSPRKDPGRRARPRGDSKSLAALNPGANDERSIFHLELAEKAGAAAPSEEQWAATPFLWLAPDTLLHLALFLHHDDAGALLQVSRAVCSFLSLKPQLWRTFTRRAFGTSSQRPRKFKTWRDAFVRRPRLRYRGLYALKQSYFIKPRTEEPLFANKDDKKRREQERRERRRRRKEGKSFFKIDNEVVYFRILRFHADGTCQYTMCGENE